MKPIKLFTVLLISLALADMARGEEIVVDIKQIDEKEDGLVYEHNSEKPFTGKAVQYDEYGKKVAETEYCKGKENGKRIHYFNNGQARQQIEIRDNRKHGKWLEWYENGKKQYESDYRDDKLHGKVIMWDETGQEVQVAEYLKGVMTYKKLLERNDQFIRRDIEDFTKAIELDPKFTETYYNRVVVKVNLGDNQGALEDYTKVIEPIKSPVVEPSPSIDVMNKAANYAGDQTAFERLMALRNPYQAMPLNIELAGSPVPGVLPAKRAELPATQEVTPPPLPTRATFDTLDQAGKTKVVNDFGATVSGIIKNGDGEETTAIDGPANVIEQIINSGLFSPDSVMFNITKSTVNDFIPFASKYKDKWTFQRDDSDDPGKAREREIGNIEQKLGKQRSLISELRRPGDITENEIEGIRRKGWEWLSAARRNDIISSVDERLELASAAARTLTRLERAVDGLGYRELAEGNGISDEAAQSMIEEAHRRIEFLRSYTGKNEYGKVQKWADEIRGFINTGDGVYKDWSERVEGIVKDTNKPKLVRDAARRALGRVGDMSRDFTDDIADSSDDALDFARALAESAEISRDPNSEKLANVWSAINDNAYDPEGNYSEERDGLLKQVKKYISDGDVNAARSLVLQAEILAEDMDMVGQFGRDRAYWRKLKKSLGL